MVRGRANIQHAAGTTEPKKEVFCWPVRFGAMSPGDNTCRLGFSLPKGKKPGCINVGLAEVLFSGARLKAKLSIDSSACPEGAHTPGIFDQDPCEKVIEATADARRFSSSPQGITSALTFSNEEVDEVDVLAFRKQLGYLQVERLGEIPAKKKKGRKSEDADGQTTFDDDNEDE